MPLFRCSDEFRAVFENRGSKQVLSCLRHIGKREEPGDVVAGDVTRMIIVQFAALNGSFQLRIVPILLRLFVHTALEVYVNSYAGTFCIMNIPTS